MFIDFLRTHYFNTPAQATETCLGLASFACILSAAGLKLTSPDCGSEGDGASNSAIGEIAALGSATVLQLAKAGVSLWSKRNQSGDDAVPLAPGLV